MNLPPKASPTGLAAIIQTVSLAIKLLRSPRVSNWLKIIPVLALAYVLFPLDFIPDFIPGLGQADDLTIVLLFLWVFVRLCPPDALRSVQGDAKVVDAEYRVVTDEEKPAPPAQQIGPPRK